MEARDRLFIRPYFPATDECFVAHSFMKSFVIPRLSSVEHAPPICRFDRQSVIDYWHTWLEIVLKRGESLVAVDTEKSPFILGWLAKYGDELGFMYTRKKARNYGVAKLLLKHAGLDPKTCYKRVMTPQFQAAFLNE